MRVTDEEAQLLESLGVSARLADYPLTIIALVKHIAELQERVEQLEKRKR